MSCSKKMMGVKIVLLGVWDYVICVNIGIESDTSRFSARHVHVLSEPCNDSIDVLASLIEQYSSPTPFTTM